MKKTIEYLLIFSFFIFSGCSQSPTETDEGITFSGTVTLEGETDYSGVTISLYEPVELDTALLRVNQQYPNIGIQISQEIAFDYRKQTAVKSNTSNTGGSWKIAGVKAGTYHIVAEKDGFGWEIVYNKQSGSTHFELNKEVILTSMTGSEYTFESGKTYVIKNQDVFLLDMNSLNFEAGSKIVFTSNNDLNIINSQVVFLNSGWVDITGDPGITNAKMIVEGSSVFISGLKFYAMNNGITFNDCSKSIIQNSYFSRNGKAFLPEFCDSMRVENIIVANNTDGILPQAGNMTITNNIFYNNNKGLESLTSAIQLSNSLFLENFIGATFISGNKSRVEYCEFDRNENSSLNIIGVSLFIFHNNFKNDKNCSIYVGSEYQSTDVCKPRINYNNLFGDKYAVSQLGNPYYSGLNYGNYFSIDASVNYWDSVIEAEIQIRIYDFYDDEGIGKVEYPPYRLFRIADTGIQK